MSDSSSTPNSLTPSTAPAQPAPSASQGTAPAQPGAPATPPGGQPGPQGAPPAGTKPNGSKTLQSPTFLWIAGLVLAVLLFFGLVYMISSYTSETTDDAFIAGHIVAMAPRISGQVAAVHVLDNEYVTNGELLVEIDPADYASTLGQKQAAADSADSNAKAAVAGYNLMKVKVTTAQADAAETKADADASAATNTKAQADLQRAK